MTTALPMYRRSELESADCLYRYKAIWRDGVDDRSDFALRGIGFHKVKHRYILALVANNLPQDEGLAQQAFIEGIAAAKTPSRLIPEIRQLWDRHAEYFELALDRYVTSEEKQEVGGLAFSPDLVLAHPDRNELEIVDDKTFFVALTERQALDSFQARFYIRYAMSLWKNFASYRFTFVFVRLGKSVSVVFKPDDLERLDREVTAAIAKIEQAKLDEAEGKANPWPAMAGPSCTYCELKCPIADQQLVIPKRFDSMIKAEQIAGWVTAGEQMLKVAKKALKAYASAYGPINVNGVVWDNRPSRSRVYPIDKLLEVLKVRGIMGAFEQSAEQGLTISHSALKKLIKQFPALEEDLAPYVKETLSYRFGPKKPGGEAEEVEDGE